jgi:DNA-binding LytR/AlgR family response regulator
MINCNLSQKEFEIINTKLNKLGIKDDHNVNITFIQLSDLSHDNRLLLRKTINGNSQKKLIIVSSNAFVSVLAWRIDALYFLYLPLSEGKLRQLGNKINTTIGLVKQLKLTFKGGFRMVKTINISVINGKGCYCKFFFTNDKPSLYTARISDIEKRIGEAPVFIRINRSLIVNINNLLRIEGNSAYFSGQIPIKLVLGERTISKLKKEVLWL